MSRIAVVTNYIPDYRFPVFKRLMDTGAHEYYFLTSSPIAESCQQARQHLKLKHSKTISLSLTTRHTESGTTQRESLPVPIGLARDLISFKPDVIISGDFGLRALICWLVAKLLRADFILWSEEIASSARGRSLPQKYMRKFIAHRARACLAWGAPAYDYLMKLGVPVERMFRCEQAVDNEKWISLAERIDRAQQRRELKLEGMVLLLVGRIVERKGFRKFIDAWVRAKKHLDPMMTAIIVGNGAQQAELEHVVKETGIENIRFIDTQTPEILARYYVVADVFVFPSLEDVWGLVVNEALCFGLPVLASKFAGASQQLIGNSELGTIFDPSNSTDFAEQLRTITVSTPPINRERSRQKLESITFQHSCNAITAMLDSLTRQSLPDKTELSDHPAKLVTIIQQVIPHYRVEFFRRLHARLQQSGITMHLLYGDKVRGAADTAQIINEEWAQGIDTFRYKIANINLVWQSALQSLGSSQLVVVEQSNRLLINYLLHIKRLWSSRKLAYWGHGRNMQTERPRGLRERLKAALLPQVDCWFAYTEMTRDYLETKNFPAGRITVVNNAVTDNLTAHLQTYVARSRDDVRIELGLSGRNIALFCGALYKQKRIEFLIEAAEIIRSKVPDFEMLIIGEGPDVTLVEHAVAAHHWIRYVGALHGSTTAKYWYASKLLLMPGLVGLVIVESFIAGCPIVTTSHSYHSPEIAYLQHGFNGIQTAHDVEDYADAVITLLNDESLLETLRQGCLLSASKYTMQNMVENFAQGIERCLGSRVHAQSV